MFGIFTEKRFDNVELPVNSNLLNHSILKDFYCNSPFRSFSIKYVAEGSELYCVNGNKYHVRSKEYLLANKFSEGYVSVDSEKPVTGICIDVSPAILAEVVSGFLKPDAPIADPALEVFFNTEAFLENKYAAGSSQLGAFLLQVESALLKDPTRKENLDKDFYYTLAEKIVADHLPVIKQMQSVKALKTETKKDLLRKILKGKSMIDASFAGKLSIESIALNCGISEYHFFRLFKSIFSISPHQYIIRQRLNYARQLKEVHGASVSEIAVCSGFSDIHSFSKAYKKHYGVSPSGLRTRP